MFKKFKIKLFCFVEFLAYFSEEEECRIISSSYEEAPASCQCRMIAFSREKFLILGLSPRWPA